MMFEPVSASTVFVFGAGHAGNNGNFNQVAFDDYRALYAGNPLTQLKIFKSLYKVDEHLLTTIMNHTGGDEQKQDKINSSVVAYKALTRRLGLLLQVEPNTIDSRWESLQRAYPAQGEAGKEVAKFHNNCRNPILISSERASGLASPRASTSNSKPRNVRHHDPHYIPFGMRIEHKIERLTFDDRQDSARHPDERDRAQQLLIRALSPGTDDPAFLHNIRVDGKVDGSSSDMSDLLAAHGLSETLMQRRLVSPFVMKSIGIPIEISSTNVNSALGLRETYNQQLGLIDEHLVSADRKLENELHELLQGSPEFMKHLLVYDDFSDATPPMTKNNESHIHLYVWQKPVEMPIYPGTWKRVEFNLQKNHENLQNNKVAAHAFNLVDESDSDTEHDNQEDRQYGSRFDSQYDNEVCRRSNNIIAAPTRAGVAEVLRNIIMDYVDNGSTHPPTARLFFALPQDERATESDTLERDSSRNRFNVIAGTEPTEMFLRRSSSKAFARASAARLLNSQLDLGEQSSITEGNTDFESALNVYNTAREQLRVDDAVAPVLSVKHIKVDEGMPHRLKSLTTEVSSESGLSDDLEKFEHLFSESPESIFRMVIADRVKTSSASSDTEELMPVVVAWHETMGKVGAWRALPIEEVKVTGTSRVRAEARAIDPTFTFLLRAAPTKAGAALAIQHFIAKDLHSKNLHAIKDGYPESDDRKVGSLAIAVPKRSDQMHDFRDQSTLALRARQELRMVNSYSQA